MGLESEGESPNIRPNRPRKEFYEHRYRRHHVLHKFGSSASKCRRLSSKSELWAAESGHILGDPPPPPEGPQYVELAPQTYPSDSGSPPVLCLYCIGSALVPHGCCAGTVRVLHRYEHGIALILNRYWLAPVKYNGVGALQEGALSRQPFDMSSLCRYIQDYLSCS